VSTPISVLFTYEIKRYKIEFFRAQRGRKSPVEGDSGQFGRHGSFLNKSLFILLQNSLKRISKPNFCNSLAIFSWLLDDINTKCFAVLLAFLEAFLSVSSTFTFASVQVLVFFTDVLR
jgi:hypothetical protein